MQASEQCVGQRRPGFVKGKSGNPRGSRLVIEKRAQMLADFERECGRPIVGTDRVMAERGIEMLTRRPRSHDEAVRLLNAGSRIIDRLRAKYAKRDPIDERVLAEILAAGGEDDSE
jgi:hypothetical protein